MVCGKPQFDDAQQDTLLNPIVILEVLSAATEKYDRGGKFLPLSQTRNPVQNIS